MGEKSHWGCGCCGGGIFGSVGAVAATLRLLERVLRTYPRAFQVVLTDALYAEAYLGQT
jgi:hypothetical protein